MLDHGDELLAVWGGIDFVNAADVRMVQSGRRLSFEDESLSRVVVAGQFLRQDLERHL